MIPILTEIVNNLMTDEKVNEKFALWIDTIIPKTQLIKKRVIPNNFVI